MDTLKVDVRGIPDEKIGELERLIERWRQEARITDEPVSIKRRKVDPSEFIVKESDVIGGEVTRAMAYDE